MTEEEFIKYGAIFIDTREQNIIYKYIVPYFQKKKINIERKKLDFGDYSFSFKGETYEKKFAIERKNSLNELASNFGKERERFEKEFVRSNGARIILMIENGNYHGILKKTYKSKLNEKAFYGSLLSYRNKYNLDIDFVFDCFSGLHIFYNCYYYLRNEEMKKGIWKNEDNN